VADCRPCDDQNRRCAWHKPRKLDRPWLIARQGVDGRGVPLGVVIEGANVPDQKLVGGRLKAIPIERFDAYFVPPQNICFADE
jgi:hypothetical protein